MRAQESQFLKLFLLSDLAPLVEDVGGVGTTKTGALTDLTQI